ncbi:biotin/lipoyl-binding protein [Hespellia stercorisuis]|uniref:Biotin-lipoyl like n=1 Tax=Hespellia stercorisuis DSM 15480 TaxID=1121950 RepID=A0A1M6MNF9_9FIRM|nr:biotin/lipoyl-binding protein [Hespellia stercorisuis]SHJ84974.1 Biotin-lipoyl like [Hespellia stercorisuis DSM 15480]
MRSVEKKGLWKKLWNFRIKTLPGGRKNIVTAACFFLGAMLLCTFLSRAAASVTVPKVTKSKPLAKVIEHRVEAEGKVIQNRERAVIVEPDLTVASIYVSEGQQVEAGEVLFALDMQKLDEAILKTNQEIEKLRLANADSASQQSITDQKQTAALARARQDYDTATATGDQAVDDAARELARAQEQLDAFYNGQGCDSGEEDGTDTVLESLQSDWEQKRTLAEQLQEKWDGLSSDEKEEQPALMEELESARIDAEAAEQAFSQYEQQRAAQENVSSADKENALVDAYESKKKAYQDALNARDAGQTAAERAVQDAQIGTPSDSTIQTNEMDMRLKQLSLDRLQALKEQGGKVAAEGKGVVTKLDLQTGGLTTRTAAVTMADLSSGTRFVAQVPGEDAKYLSTGDAVELTPTSGGGKVTGVTISSVGTESTGGVENAGGAGGLGSTGNTGSSGSTGGSGDTGSSGSTVQDMQDVIVLLPQGELSVGVHAKLTCSRQSASYPLCVPVQALHMDQKQYYVFVLQKEETVLGTVYRARRADVTVAEKNTQYAALEAGGVSAEDAVIVSADREVEAGATVRLEE